jgi:hypothetical protein
MRSHLAKAFPASREQPTELSCWLCAAADTTTTRELLATGDGDSVAARSRNFASLAAHKQPIAPRTPAKSFERRTASGKHLLNALSTGRWTLADCWRHLLFLTFCQQLPKQPIGCLLYYNKAVESFQCWHIYRLDTHIDLSQVCTQLCSLHIHAAANWPGFFVLPQTQQPQGSCWPLGMATQSLHAPATLPPWPHTSSLLHPARPQRALSAVPHLASTC